MAAEAAPLLRVRDVSMRFGGLWALAGVSFEVRQGSITALIGPNGAGKTTLFNCITGFYRPTGGSIALVEPAAPERPLGRLPIHRVARLGIGRTYQNVRLFPRMSALENLLVAQHRELERGFFAGVFQTLAYRRAETAAFARAWAWLRFVGLEPAANREAGTLPYGQQRRLELARALAARPRLICLDEPAAGLNRTETAELIGLIRRVQREHGVTVLLIEHHMGVVMALSEHVVVLDHGEVIGAGTPAEIQRDPRVIGAYLGQEPAPAATQRREAQP
jgi:branched-chain amino acid transport system ATP-binding protein